MPVTRTSLAGAAVVAVAKRCSASRRDGAPASSTSRSTVGRQDDEATVGTAKRASRISTGLTEANSTIVIASRRIQPAVEKTDMYMWSRTKTWSRSTESRSRYSGRSWWAMVVTEACRRATWDSRPMVTLSRNRRCTRVETVVRNQVDAPAAPRSRHTLRSLVASPARTASAIALKPMARRASGRAATRASTKATDIRAGSC